MIVGLTHTQEKVAIQDEFRFKGKISTGFAPGEGPNKQNYPVACGFFRVLNSVIETKEFKGKVFQDTSWKLWVEMQKRLETLCGNIAMPSIVSFVSMFKTPEEMWDSNLSKFSASGLACRSNGYGTPAKMLVQEGDDRQWVNRKFGDFDGCMHETCPDFVSGACKPYGILKLFPLFDPSVEPYKYETKSAYVIKEIEGMLNRIYNLSQISHKCKQEEAGRELQFDGLFGLKFHLVHKKKKLGGKDVFISEVVPSEETSRVIMDPIKRVMSRNFKASLAGGAQVSLLGMSNSSQSQESTNFVTYQQEEVVDEVILANVEEAKAKSEAQESVKNQEELINRLVSK